MWHNTHYLGSLDIIHSFFTISIGHNTIIITPITYGSRAVCCTMYYVLVEHVQCTRTELTINHEWALQHNKTHFMCTLDMIKSILWPLWTHHLLLLQHELLCHLQYTSCVFSTPYTISVALSVYTLNSAALAYTLHPPLTL